MFIINTKEGKKTDIIMNGNIEQTMGKAPYKQLVKKSVVLLHG